MIKISIKYLLVFFPVVLLTLGLMIEYDVISFYHESPNRVIVSDMDNNNTNSMQTFEFSPGNAVARNTDSYHYDMIDFQTAENQYSIDLDTVDIKLGKNRFETFCSHCHGFTGEGDGKIITDTQLTEDEDGFPAPPTFLRTETIQMSNARLFHIISSGQNIMTSKSHLLNEQERWSIVKYIRHLQSNPE